MASGEYRRPQSDSGVSFRCLRLKCELYLNVCLSISISLCPAHRLFNSFSTLRSTKITLYPPLYLSPFRSLCNRRTYQIACKLTNCQLRFLFLYHRILLLLYGLHTHSKLLCKCSVSVFIFIRFLKRVWPHEQRLYWSLDWYMAYARHRRNVFSSWSVNQLTSCAGSAVPRLRLSQN